MTQASKISDTQHHSGNQSSLMQISATNVQPTGKFQSVKDEGPAPNLSTPYPETLDIKDDSKGDDVN